MTTDPELPPTEGSPAPWWAWCGTRELTAVDRRNLRRFNLWTLAWMTSWIAALAILVLWEDHPRAVALSLTAAAIILGLGAMAAYWHFLRRADELLRAIQLQGLAFGFGAGVLVMTSYALLQRLGAPDLDAADPLLAMILGWGVGQWVAARRYLGTSAK